MFWGSASAECSTPSGTRRPSSSSSTRAGYCVPLMIHMLDNGLLLNFDLLLLLLLPSCKPTIFGLNVNLSRVLARAVTIT